MHLRGLLQLQRQLLRELAEAGALPALGVGAVEIELLGGIVGILHLCKTIEFAQSLLAELPMNRSECLKGSPWCGACGG